MSFVRVARIELASRPWQGRVLPLNHTRIYATFGCTHQILKQLPNTEVF